MEIRRKRKIRVSVVSAMGIILFFTTVFIGTRNNWSLAFERSENIVNVSFSKPLFFIFAAAFTALFVILSFSVIRSRKKRFKLENDLIRSYAHMEESIQKRTYELKDSESKMRELNRTLESKVQEQLVEIKNSFELEQKARRDLLELDKAKDQFIATTQHHLRTPLTTVKWCIEGVLSGQQGVITQEIATTLHKAAAATSVLLKLVNEFLDITSLQFEKGLLKLEMVDLREIVEKNLEELKPEIDKNQIITSLVFPHDFMENFVLIDKEKMNSAIMKLLDNAVRYNKVGGLLRVEGVKIPNHAIKDGFVYRLTVEDTGIGISPEDMSKLFSQYFKRGKKAEEQYPTGRGIELSVVKSIINAHNGKVWAESNGEDTGSKFVIELPIL
jgi:signal transduction histidine kinase